MAAGVAVRAAEEEAQAGKEAAAADVARHQGLVAQAAAAAGERIKDMLLLLLAKASQKWKLDIFSKSIQRYRQRLLLRLMYSSWTLFDNAADTL